MTELEMVLIRMRAQETLIRSLQEQQAHYNRMAQEHRVAIATLDSERAMNARLTEDVDRLSADNEALRRQAHQDSLSPSVGWEGEVYLWWLDNYESRQGPVATRGRVVLRENDTCDVYIHGNPDD